MSMVLIYGSQFRYNGLAGGLKRFAQPMPLLTPINIMEIAIRPLALCMRLFGNVLGAYIIMEIIKYLVPAVVPAVFCLYFDLFDGLIQTVVFVFLTALFTGEGIKGRRGVTPHPARAGLCPPQPPSSTQTINTSPNHQSF